VHRSVTAIAMRFTSCPPRSRLTIISRSCALVAFFVGGAMASVSAVSSRVVLEPGVYRQIEPAAKRSLQLGNEIVLTRDKYGVLKFTINAVRQLDRNIGTISGTIDSRLPTTWTSKREFANCRLRFRSAPAGFTVTQDYEFGDCGGYGVTANGTYLRVVAQPRRGMLSKDE